MYELAVYEMEEYPDPFDTLININSQHYKEKYGAFNFE